MTKPKITRLTDEQQALFPSYVKTWTDIGLSTEPADRPRAERAIREMYRVAGLSPPQRIVWCGSPMSQALTRAIVLGKLGDRVGDSVKDSVMAGVGASVWVSVKDSVMDSAWGSVLDSVRASVEASIEARIRSSVKDSVMDSAWGSVVGSVCDIVGDSVWGSVGDSVRASFEDRLWASAWDSVKDSVMAGVGTSVWASVRASVRASVWDSVRDSVYGCHDASWLAFYRYFRDVCGLIDETKRLSGPWELAQSAGWILPHEHICWVSERYNVLRRDDQGRLHSESGPACTYPDGWAIHAWHGVRVPAEWIENKAALSAQTALTWSNIEQRRAACEIVGWNRILAALDAKTIDKHPDPQIGELVEVSLPDSGKERFLRVQCGTLREFAIPVPRDVTTAIEAQAWIWGLNPKEFHQPEVRT